MKKVFLSILLIGFLIGYANRSKVLDTSSVKRDYNFSGKVIFENLDELSGKLIDYSSTRLVWKSPYSLGDLSFKSANIKEIFFSQFNESSRFSDKSEVRLVNGDTIFGDLVEFNDLELVMDTSYAGRLTINRVSIYALKIASSHSEVLFQGPKSISKWVQSSKDEKNQWKYAENKLFLLLNQRREVGIGREFKFPNKFEISFDYKWLRANNLNIYFFVSDLKRFNSGSYRLAINNNNISMHKKTRNQRFGRNLGNHYIKTFSNLPEKSAKITLKIDKKTSSFYFYINDKLEKVFKDEYGSKILGSGLTFSSTVNIEISKIAIKRWSGKVSNTKNFGNKTYQKDKIIFSNNDSVSGTFKGYKDGVISFESSFGLLPNLTPDRVSAIIFANKKFKKQNYTQKDVELYFNDRKLTFQLDRISNGKIFGKSVSLGEVSFDLKGFKKINFRPKN